MPSSTDAQSKPNPVRHVVCLKFKQGTRSSAVKSVEREFAALRDKIPGILSIEWGTNDSPEGLNKEFTHCFIVSFENDAARRTYLPHPQHQAFVSILRPILEDVFVIDFTL